MITSGVPSLFYINTVLYIYLCIFLVLHCGWAGTVYLILDSTHGYNSFFFALSPFDFNGYNCNLVFMLLQWTLQPCVHISM